ELSPADLGAHCFTSHLVARVLNPTVDEPFDPVLAVVSNTPGADESAEAAREVCSLRQIAANELVELGRLLLERSRFREETRFGLDHEHDLVGTDVGQAEDALRNDPVGLEALEPPNEIEQHVVVGFPTPDLFDAPFGTWPEDQDGERAADLQLFPELFGQRLDRRQPRIAVVQTRPLLLPLAAEGNKLTLASFSCHVSVVVEDSITPPSLARDLAHATGSWLVPVVQRRQTHGDRQRRPAGRRSRTR